MPAAAEIRRKLRSGRLFVAGIRDYDELVQEKPTVTRSKLFNRRTDVSGITSKRIDIRNSEAGFIDARWMMPAETGFYQPIVTAKAELRWRPDI